METNSNNTDNVVQRVKVPPAGGFRGAIILEDEELPRLSLKSKLETYHPDIQILDMCDNCDDALESILRHKPQLLFLDIQLPGKTSLWLVEQLEKMMKLPLIIFTTAYTDPEYLIKAIKISAVDYLQKPVNLMELSQALEKVRKKLSEEKTTTQKPDLQQYRFKTYNSHLILSSSEIVYIQADGNYAQIRLLDDKEELAFERLGEIEHRLDDSIFVRAGRSLIINKMYLHKLNYKESSCQLSTPNAKYNLSIPRAVFDELKQEIEK